MAHDSLLTGENAAFIDEQYRKWLAEPGSIDPSWAAYFESWDRPSPTDPRPLAPPPARATSLFHGGAAVGVDHTTALKQAKVAQLINAYRVRGHLVADIDPLDSQRNPEHPELTLGYYGLSQADLTAAFATAPLYAMPAIASLSQIVARCRQAYCAEIGAEFMNIDEVDQKQWVAEQLEQLPDRQVLTHQEERRVLRKLADAENFERMLHARYPGTKRFSVEGAETLVPLLDTLIGTASQTGIGELVFGMAHRGRLNVLANIFEKPVRTIIDEFEDVQGEDAQGSVQGSGDVKYHLGISTDVLTDDGSAVHLSLTPNPSHLEAVDPVVQGRVRAKQDRLGPSGQNKVMAVLIHGDAAFAGQGLVAETLQLSELAGYCTGGTIHIVVNNQIGFTTTSSNARSTPYATGVARMLGVPIFHVNGESPRAVAAVVQIALKWRNTYHRDVVIDMYCYRKYGHNEGDEPAFTQPVMYQTIRSRKTPTQNYAHALVNRGTLTTDEADAIITQSASDMATRVKLPKRSVFTGRNPLTSKPGDQDTELYHTKDLSKANPGTPATSYSKDRWSNYANSARQEVDTGFPLDRLAALIEQVNTLPSTFTPNRKVKRLLAQRILCAKQQRPVDWAVAEQAAFATLLAQGHPVRLSGQDSGRGTFSHRHANLVDPDTAQIYTPLQRIHPGQPAFAAWDSNLSEAGVLGFDYGYSLDYPDALVLWEAQFGDFANGAQVLVDQYLAPAEQKWQRLSGLVLLLPHGYEGQGPEHSSARLERYLQLCAEDNMQVAMPTTPANFFHLLRRQVLRNVRKPLVVMTPKSGLRHPRWVSSLTELAEGSFAPVIADPTPPQQVNRLVFCSGKVYYDLDHARTEQEVTGVAIHRVELLYPFPHRQVAGVLAEHPQAQVVWCQEEPRNMGAYPVILDGWLQHHPKRPLHYAGRPAAASPASGSHAVSRSQQRALVDEALRLR